MIYALTIFTAAFLLFQIQPLFGKFILPWFGGSTSVWTTCMLFFQVFLLAGYAYAHLSVRFLKVNAQLVLHGLLVMSAIGMLPVMPDAGWKPVSPDNPVWQVLLLLTAHLGLPYFVLASTSPLLQAWFSRVHAGAAPYRLYSLSNAGSLLALLSYPLLVEPMFTRAHQSIGWSAGFVLFILLTIGCGWGRWQVHSGAGDALPGDSGKEVSPPSARVRMLWVLLPAAAAVMLLAVTNQVCLDIAVVPFLWVVPLAIYLGSFVICFNHERWYFRPFWMIGLYVSSGLTAWLVLQEGGTSMGTQIGILGALLLCASMVCHGELYRLRPAPRYLTGFYLMLAAGGALGGLFVALIAPLVFNIFLELHLGIVMCLVLVLVILHHREVAFVKRRPDIFIRALAMVCLVGISVPLYVHAEQRLGGKLEVLRNFYGVLTIDEIDATRADEAPGESLQRAMLHGRITHGIQFMSDRYRRFPTTYYLEGSGIGRLLALKSDHGRRVAVVGLGIGTLAAYGRPGDLMRFYEINPAVTTAAREYFTYLEESRADIDIVPGDARLSLEREPPGHYDVIVLDAFNSDSPPVHLLTQEAFELYFKHLSPDGVIAVNITNKHLDMSRLLSQQAAEAGAHPVLLVNADEPPFISSWLLMSRDQRLMTHPHLQEITVRTGYRKDRVAGWTDDYSSLLQVLR